VIGEYDQKKEFETEMTEARIAIEEYKKTAPDVMDKEKVTLLTDAASIAQGKTIFTTNCVACHRADAGGQIGPNLTDAMWINGGGIKNVFNVLMEGGRDGKGMISWKATIKPSDLQKVASYVLSLQGSNPKEPKPTEPEAKLWVEEGASKTKGTTAPADTTKVDAKVVAAK
jgi:cytochrome c oxidase cbb3-type subunit 3